MVVLSRLRGVWFAGSAKGYPGSRAASYSINEFATLHRLGLNGLVPDWLTGSGAASAEPSVA